MGKCIECARFPWVPGADYSMLPAIKCAKELEARRWTKKTAALEHNCPYYHGPGAVKDNDTDNGPEAVKDNDTDNRTESEAPATSRRKNPRRRK